MSSATICECQNCDWRGPASDLDPIEERGIFDVVSPGEPMPYGRCPDCNAVAHAADAPTRETALKTIALSNADFALLLRCLAVAEYDAAGKAGMIVNDGGMHKRILREVERLRAYIEKLASPRPVTAATMASDAVDLLRDARDLLKQAGASRAVDRVKLAITSAGGAVRHAQGKADRGQYAEV